ncbi:sensor histidine kinase [Sphingomonas canadensis]|uniref:histidine kinase n=1 Tax=Sphingomonas canadensis TaxID=1219257 RepID=A0ABW3H2K4_9SPHN|nr:histidine kinase [Sphingomonas canadensis]
MLPAGLRDRIERLPTGAKVFLILVLALLPLALIALFTTLRTTGMADAEARARLNAAANESSGVLASILKNHIAELKEGLSALESDRADAPGCTRVAGAFAALADTGTRFAIVDRRGELLCGQRFSVAGASVLGADQASVLFLPDGLVLRIGGSRGASALAFYPTSALGQLSRPNGLVAVYGSAIVRGAERLDLRPLPAAGALERNERVEAPLGVDGLQLEMSMRGAAISQALILATVLLVLMWIAAAGISWFVVDRLLIRPLRRLRSAVQRYRPGEEIDPTWSGSMPAQEIRELGETFREISRTVQAHEAGLAEGLVRQTRLTREVHHRVKNNLQVIASLINFHARGPRSPEVGEAYASIQRRVDALAVVHRHHFAEIEESRGLELRAVIGELAANLRATAPERASGMTIMLEVEPLLVTQDVAVAVAFLITEIVELAMARSPNAPVRIAARTDETAPDRATLRVLSPALVGSPELDALVESRYGRVMGGLARQLRTALHHDPLLGAYEAGIAVTGRS